MSVFIKSDISINEVFSYTSVENLTLLETGLKTKDAWYWISCLKCNGLGTNVLSTAFVAVLVNGLVANCAGYWTVHYQYWFWIGD